MDFQLVEGARAFVWGCLSSLSLPLGAAVGLHFNPSHKKTSTMMAFGAGALLAALSFELVASSLEHAGYYVMCGGFLAGSLVYIAINRVLNNSGAFLRRESTTINYLTEKKREQTENLLERLSHVESLRELPPDEVEAIVPYARPMTFKEGEIIFKQGEPGLRLYLIEEGEAQVIDEKEGDRQVAVLGPGATFGEIALLTGDKRLATIRAKTPMKALTLAKADFDRLLTEFPKLKAAVHTVLERHLAHPGLSHVTKDAREWAKAAKASISYGDLTPTSEDIQRAQTEAGGGAPMAIWLGILLDGIPESLVIGASMLGGMSVNPALFFGVFLADFPEAMSSAVGMRRQGMSDRKIMWMWGSLCLMMGVGAAIGILTFASVPVPVKSFLEALAAGAMLTVIAETMLPEAVEQGGSAIGFTTVIGFLMAIGAAVLLPHH